MNSLKSTIDLGVADYSSRIITDFGDLPPDTLLTERALAGIFGLCTTSIKRAVERGELPPPVKVCGKPRWTVKSIVDHIDAGLETVKQEAEADAKRMARYSE